MSQKISQRLKKAYFFARIFQLVPYVQSAAVADTVITHEGKKNSDIDFFIIAKKNHIFTVRYGCVFWATVFGQKALPEKGKIQDKICLSFFVADDSLNLDYLNRNTKEAKKRAEWITRLIPLHDENNEFLSFIIKNKWIKKYQKNYYFNFVSRLKYAKTFWFFWFVQKILELIFFFGIGWIVEQIIKGIQLKRLTKYQIRYLKNQRMIFNSKIIKLHFQKDLKKEIF